MRTRRLSWLLILPLLIAACAPRVAGSRENSSEQLTIEMMSRYPTVGAAIQALRSSWLVQRTPATLGIVPASPVWVYRDGTRVGDAGVLTYLSTAEVSVIDYFNAAQASRRWGTNHENGVIHITSRSSRSPR